MDMSSTDSMPSMEMSTGMAMSMSTGTATAGAASATSSAAMSMDMGMGMGGDSCKISMLWNWNTVDSCFLSSTWHVTSKGMFAGSCIGVICLVISLEFLRRLTKEYDRYLIRKHGASSSVRTINVNAAGKSGDQSSPNSGTEIPLNRTISPSAGSFRPSVAEQAVRALLHMLQFAVAYFVMLLAMYYNGYIIICIFIGAYLGAFVFHWETLGLG
ncbi:Copper Transporter integral membrane protein that functions in high affinity copper transport [Lecanora helva]